MINLRRLRASIHVLVLEHLSFSFDNVKMNYISVTLFYNLLYKFPSQ
jgi:hypothetical protein